MNKNPIGVFDSGIGGLTVVKEIVKSLPKESIIYLGDTARVPYGTRSKAIIAKFALELTQFLLKHQVKILVVACNTISATCLEQIKKISPVPVIGVIKPAALSAVNTTKTKNIAIIGTRATIASQVYEKEILSLNSDIKIFTKACPLFVPIAEEGLGNKAVGKLMAKKYLQDFKNTNIDTLILGCTHYPLLLASIKTALKKDINIIDSAIPTTLKLIQLLTDQNLLNSAKTPNYQFFVTDDPERVQSAAQLFYGKNLAQLKKITI